MFTGIIEYKGTIKEINSNGGNKIFWIASPIYEELSVDQSLSHNGVCLTVEEIKNGMHRVTAIEETLRKTNLHVWEEGTIINLERCMQANGRFDGHIVQGHVDCTAECVEIVQKEGSWEYKFSFDKQYNKLIIEKGSVTVNGISLTCFNVSDDSFTVAIIPYTYNNTNLNGLNKNELVNIEWDLVGKYVTRMMAL